MLWLTLLLPLTLQAAARHQCSYLVNLHVNDFLQVGGDPKWLNGLDEAPRKLQPLGELNKILAHRPWLLTKEHIEVSGRARSEGCSRSCVKAAAATPARGDTGDLCSAADSETSCFFFENVQQLVKAEEHSWSLAELIHAVVLLTHYHSLASFTFGCGIMPEIHSDGGHTFRPPSLSQYCVCDIANGNGHANHHDDLLGNQVSDNAARACRLARGQRCPDPRCPPLFLKEMCGEVEVLMERMKQLQECRDDEEASQEEMATRFEREKTESMLVVTAEDEESAPSRDISRHFEDPSYGYKEFSRRGEQVPTLRVQVRVDYSRRWGGSSPSRWFTVLFLRSPGLQLGGSRLLPGQQTLPRCRTDAGREVPVGLQPHLQHHGDAQRCGHQHAAPSHLELHPLHVRHQVSSRAARVSRGQGWFVRVT